MSEKAETAAWRTNALLFLGTVASVFATGVLNDATPGGLKKFLVPIALLHGAQFAGTLLTILVAHELGHYVAARIHRVDASLPFFIPMPLLSPFGTMGAVIRMRGTIPTRRALLDIGAAGPLAGLVFAIPLYAWGAAHSTVVPIPADGTAAQLGDSILLRILDSTFAPARPAGMDLELGPVAFGAWGGMFVTMINLLPVGQLDGGHVAYALFGPRQDRLARFIHRTLLVFFVGLVVYRMGTDVSHLGKYLSNGMFWLFWFQLLAVLGTVAARGRDEGPPKGFMPLGMRLGGTIGLLVLASFAREKPGPLFPGLFLLLLALMLGRDAKAGVLRRHDLLDHPPTGLERLDVGRAAVAIITLILFVMLFMPGADHALATSCCRLCRCRRGTCSNKRRRRCTSHPRRRPRPPACHTRIDL